MRFVVEMSGEHPTLPAAEVRSVLGVESVDRDGRVAVVEADEDAPYGRLGLAHYVGEHLASADSLEALVDQAAGWEAVGSPFAVRATSQDGDWDRQAILDRLGDALADGREVDLKQPASIVRVVGGEKLHAHRVLASIDRAAMRARVPHKRSAFKPTSLAPKLARALVNLARPETGVLDPFAGTGGLLLEARLMGVPAVGLDRAADAVAGAARNLADEGVEADLVRGDARHLPLAGGVDAVATDLPYGRSTRTGGLEPVELLEAVAEPARDLLSVGDRMVAVLPEPIPELSGWRLDERFDWRVHRSLTRSIHVFVAA